MVLPHEISGFDRALCYAEYATIIFQKIEMDSSVSILVGFSHHGILILQHSMVYLIKFFHRYMSIFQLPYFPEFYLSWKDYELLDHLFRNSSNSDKEAYKFTFGKPGKY